LTKGHKVWILLEHLTYIYTVKIYTVQYSTVQCVYVYVYNIYSVLIVIKFKPTYKSA